MRKSILILFFALLGVFSAQAYDFEVDGIYYEFKNAIIMGDYGVVRVVYAGVTYRDNPEDGDRSDYTGTIVIPSEVEYNGDTYSVTSIRSSAFSGCSGLTSVTIPESVTYLGDSAFSGCSGLTSVEWNVVDCRDFILWGNGFSPFDGCENITSITFGNQVERIPAYLCYELRGLTSVTIGESVTSIGKYAFMDCSGLTSVEWNAVACRDFYEPSYDSYVYTKPFYNDTNITSITFGSQVEHIPAYLCENMYKITSVTIPDNVTSIGDYAFSDCSGLTKVTSLATLPPSCTENTFGSDSYYAMPLYTLSVSKPFYAVAKGWRKFAKIEALDVKTYTVTVNVNDAAMGMVIGGGEYDSDKRATLVAISNNGYRFVKWDDNNTSNPRILTVTGDTTLTAIFAKDESDDPVVYTVTVRANDAAMGMVVGGGEYEIGERATLAAIPNNGYRFVKWDDENTDNPRILTVTGDTSFTAIFVQGDPTANENAEADNLRVYVQDRTICLSEDRGTVQVYNVAGQCVYNGHATVIPVPQSGVYVVRVGARSYKIVVY